MIVPPPDLQKYIYYLERPSCEEDKEALLKRVKELDDEAEDRKLALESQ